MTLSLYEAIVPSTLQVLGSVDGLLDKAQGFANERGVSAADAIDWRLAPDMLPFGYQVKSCADHSVGAIEGTRAGSFSPSMKPWPTDWAGLKALIANAIATLHGIDRAEFDALAGADTHFRMGEMALPFAGAQFLLSFSQPNFYFHATTAYAILRKEGVALGKRDFLGKLRVRR